MQRLCNSFLNVPDRVKIVQKEGLISFSIKCAAHNLECLGKNMHLSLETLREFAYSVIIIKMLTIPILCSSR